METLFLVIIDRDSQLLTGGIKLNVERVQVVLAPTGYIQVGQNGMILLETELQESL